MFAVKEFVTCIILVCFTSKILSQEADYCYADDQNPYLFMGTRTPYRQIRGGETGKKSIPQCEPIQLWLLARHGTRYPSVNIIKGMLDLPDFRDEILENHVVHGRGELCEKDLDNLGQWQVNPKMTAKKAKFLVPEGFREHNDIAKRLQSNYPELLMPDKTSVNSENYKFRSTSTQRTIASMGAFMEGLFGDKIAVDAEVVPRSNDTLLRAHRICPAWQDLLQDPSTNKDLNDFLDGPEYQDVISNVSQRLGFTDDLTLDQVNLLYQTCRFEKAWSRDKISPWCSVFQRKELEVLEYEDDLYHYYHTGYGTKMSSLIGCPPLQDMFIHFLKMENGGEGEPKAIFYFTHDVTIQLLYVSMGVFKDSVPLTATNFEQMGNRKWRTSSHASFAANLVAVFYKCNSDENGKSSYKVEFRSSERPLILDGCESALCDWEKVKEILGPVANKCSLDFCYRKEDSSQDE